MSESTKVLQISDISEGEAKCVEISGTKVAVFNVGGTYYAIQDTCTHAGGPLSDGTLDGTEVSCPWHGACFDITTGKMMNGPAKADLQTYKVTVVGDELKIEKS